jgi:hypothetical protein
MNFEPISKTITSLPALSVVGTLHDYERVLQTIVAKREKRLVRTGVTCLALYMTPDIFIKNLILPSTEATFTPTPRDLADFFVEDLHPTEYPDAAKALALNREVNGELTKALNSTSLVYQLSCHIIARLLDQLEKHPILGPLYKSKEILFLLKGSMAQKRVLKALRPDLAGMIENAFGSGGDNDCMFMINPARADFGKIHALLTNFTNQVLLRALPQLSAGQINIPAQQISAIQVLGSTLPVTASTRQSFHMYLKDGRQMRTNTSSEKANVYVSWNDTLDFKDECGNACQFSLIRIKYAFDVQHCTGTRTFGAEVLDIAISQRGDYQLQNDFEHYRDDGWITALSFNDI